MVEYNRPLPSVGDRVRKFCGPRNPNNWNCAAEVRAIVDDCAVVVLRWLVHKRYHTYQVIDALEWSTLPYVHLPKHGEAIPLPKSWRHLDGMPMEGAV